MLKKGREDLFLDTKSKVSAMEKWLLDKGFVFHEGAKKYWKIFSIDNDPYSFRLLWIFPGYLRGTWTMQWHYDMDIPFLEIKQEIQNFIDGGNKNLRHDKMIFYTPDWEQIFP